MQNDIVNIQQISVLLGLSRRHVSARVVTLPAFPAPVVRLSQRTRFWSAADVSRFLLSARGAGAGNGARAQRSEHARRFQGQLDFSAPPSNTGIKSTTTTEGVNQ